MAFVGTVAQETPRLSTDADGVSRDAIARHGNEGVRLKQVSKNLLMTPLSQSTIIK